MGHQVAHSVVCVVRPVGEVDHKLPMVALAEAVQAGRTNTKLEEAFVCLRVSDCASQD